MNYFPKSVFFLLAFVVSSSHAVKEHVIAVDHLEASVEVMSKFHSWTAQHEKSYDSHDEKMKRLRIWVENDGRCLCLCFMRMMCDTGDGYYIVTLDLVNA
jgi:hypothetical protein